MTKLLIPLRDEIAADPWIIIGTLEILHCSPCDTHWRIGRVQ